MEKINKFNSDNFFVFFITGLFIVEIIFTVYSFYFNDNLRYVGFFKLLFEAFLIIIIPFKRPSKLVFYGLILLIFTYGLNQIINPLFFKKIMFHFSKGSIYYLNRYVFIFIFILAFLGLKNKIQIAKQSITIIEHILFVNSFFIIFGVISNIEFFTSYPQSPLRFGSDGFFNKVNEVSYFYIIYILTLYYRCIKQESSIWKLIFITLSSILIGTKTVILFLSLLFLLHFLFVSKFRKKFAILAILPFLFLFYFFKDILNIAFNIFPFWRALRDNYSILSLVFSTRDLLVIENYHYVIDNWSLTNYFIGGPFYTESFTRTRMDFFDLFLHFGLTSTVIYLFIISKHFFYKNNTILNALSGILIFCGFLTGGLFLRVSAIIYMFLAFYVLNNETV